MIFSTVRCLLIPVSPRRALILLLPAPPACILAIFNLCLPWAGIHRYQRYRVRIFTHGTLSCLVPNLGVRWSKSMPINSFCKQSLSSTVTKDAQRAFLPCTPKAKCVFSVSLHNKTSPEFLGMKHFASSRDNLSSQQLKLAPAQRKGTQESVYKSRIWGFLHL